MERDDRRGGHGAGPCGGRGNETVPQTPQKGLRMSPEQPEKCVWEGRGSALHTFPGQSCPVWWPQPRMALCTHNGGGMCPKCNQTYVECLRFGMQKRRQFVLPMIFIAIVF